MIMVMIDTDDFLVLVSGASTFVRRVWYCVSGDASGQRQPVSSYHRRIRSRQNREHQKGKKHRQVIALIALIALRLCFNWNANRSAIFFLSKLHQWVNAEMRIERCAEPLLHEFISIRTPYTATPCIRLTRHMAYRSANLT